MRDVRECRHCHGPARRADLHDHDGQENDCYATWTCVNPNCRSSSDIAVMVCLGNDDEAEANQGREAGDVTPVKVEAPFTADQVASLNAYQVSGFFHPFTCGADDCHGIRLIAANDGWHCASQACGYRQSWAHAFMANWAWNNGVKWGAET